MADTDDRIEIELRQQQDYRFEARFPDTAIAPLVTDEPAPLGGGTGPGPTRLLTTAVANCLSASLLFAMRKYKNEPGPIRTHATAWFARNESNRLRVDRIEVEMHLGIAADAVHQLERILAQYEDFCVVTQSVRPAIPVTAAVFDRHGMRLTRTPAM